MFVSHIDCHVTTLLDWTEKLFFTPTSLQEAAEANQCGVMFQWSLGTRQTSFQRIRFLDEQNQSRILEELR